MKSRLIRSGLLAVCAAAALALSMAGPACAKGGGGGGAGGVGGMGGVAGMGGRGGFGGMAGRGGLGGRAGSHMSSRGLANTNGHHALDRDRGRSRAADRHAINTARQLSRPPGPFPSRVTR